MAITYINTENQLSWPPQMIQPLTAWVAQVIRLHKIVQLATPTLSPYWIRAYENNESPFYACLSNYDFGPSPFSEVAEIRANPRYSPAMEMPPLAGIGMLLPKRIEEY